MKFKIFKYNRVISTNKTAIELIKKKKIEKGFVYALSQKKGRGRCGRKWISKKGNFFGSIFFPLKKNFPSVSEFTLINPMLNIDVLSNHCEVKNLFFKSPNDIYINKKKVCGILQETILMESKKYLIVGIGINILSSPKIKNYPVTNLYKETRKKIKLAKIVNEIKNIYEHFFSHLDLYSFLSFKTKSEKLLLEQIK